MKEFFSKKYIPLYFIGFIFIFSSKLTIDPALLPRFSALSIFLLFFVVYLFFTNKSSFQISLFFIFIVVYILYSAITITYSINKVDGTFEFLKLILFLSTVFSFSILYKQKDNFIKILSRIISLITFLIVLFGIFQLFSIAYKLGLSHQNMYQVGSVFANKNIFAEVLLLFLPYSIFNIIYEKKFFRIISIVNIVLILFFIIILLSRAIWVSLVFSMIFTLVFLFFFVKNSIKNLFQNFLKNKTSWLSILLISFVLAASIVFYSQLDSFLTFRKQTSTFTILTKIKQEDRIQLWKKTIPVIKESPIVGKGLGSWKIEVLKYGNQNLHSEDNTTFYQRPHNDYLWILAEQGIIGLFLYFSLFVILLIYIVKIIKNTAHKNVKVFFMLNSWVIFAFLMISLFSFPKERVEHIILFALVSLSVIIYYNKEEKTDNKYLFNKKQIKKALLLIFLFIILSVFVGIMRITGEFYLKKAFDSRAKNNYQMTIVNIDKANSIFYKLDPFSTPIIWYKGEANFYLNNLEDAFDNFKTAYKINPYHIHVLNNLASCYELKGDHYKAIEFYKKALKISPNFDESLLNICAVYYNINKADSAFKYFHRVSIYSKNPKYQQFRYPVLKLKIGAINSNIIDEEQKKIISKIQYSETWTKDIYLKSVKNKIDFEKQLLLDVKYIQNK